MTAKVITVALTEATPEQKRHFATEFLNLDTAETASEIDIDAAIARAQPGVPTIFAFETEADEEAEQRAAAALAGSSEDQPSPGPGGMVGTLGRGDPRATIQIPVVETTDGMGKADVNVGVNGRVWQLKRGPELNVPWRVVEALQNAIGTTVDHVDKGNGDIDEVVTDTKRVGFQILSGPSKEDVAAWVERTGAEFCA